MQNSTDGCGEMVNVTVQGDGTNFTSTQPPFTFTEFIFTDPETFLKIKSPTLSNGKATLNWSSLPGAKFTIYQSTNLIDWTGYPHKAISLRITCGPTANSMWARSIM